MWEYLLVLIFGFWLGVAIFLYASCYLVEEIFDLPGASRDGGNASDQALASSVSGTAHAQLRRLVSRVVEEAASLPALSRYATQNQPPELDAGTYEDLLATAILNKVIERYQAESGSGGRSSGIHSVSASPSPSERSSPRHAHADRSTAQLQDDEAEGSDWEEGDTDAVEELVDLPRRVPFPEFGGDIVHATIENDERDFDDISTSDLQAVDGSWEENWLFQKKKIISAQSVPVPMLVPNSNTDYRVLIGDRDADDTTDLSDNASDVEDEIDYKSDIKRVLDSKCTIGGKTKVEAFLDFGPESLNSIDEIDGDENVTDAKNKQINNNNSLTDEIENNANNTQGDTVKTNNNESVLIVGIDSGPLPKAEFAVDEIHRTIINGHVENDYKKVCNGHIKKGSYPEQEKEYINAEFLNHEREGAYDEAIATPVQRYADSLRRQHFSDHQKEKTLSNITVDETNNLIPGSIAERERKKWLNYVEMPNNPYSPEAIQKRLSGKNTSAIFDIISKKREDLPLTNGNHKDHKVYDDSEKVKHEVDDKNVNEADNKTRNSPKFLKDVLADEVPQYKRYGRDYYIKEAKKSAGGRKKSSYSDTSSSSSMYKSTSLDNFDTDFASPVSASSSLSDLEAATLHHNIVRVVLSPRNASPNFAINPIYENHDVNKPMNGPTRNKDSTILNNNDTTNVSHKHKAVCNGGDGLVENDDIVRLKIPNKPKITEDKFEPFTNVRHSNTLRSDNECVRNKNQTGLNYTYGGSLRLSKNVHTDLW